MLNEKVDHVRFSIDENHFSVTNKSYMAIY